MTGRNLIFAFLLLGVGSLTRVCGQAAQSHGAPRDPQNGGPQALALEAAPKLPAPSGPFGIGRISYEWIDTSRPDAYSPDPQARRDLMVYLWYPASRTFIGRAGTYLPGAKQIAAIPDTEALTADNFGAAWPLIVSGAIESHAVEDAPPANSPGTFPVVLFSHGLGGTAFAYTSLIEDLVSHGYVVVSIEHTYTDMAVAFPKNRVVPFHRDTEPTGLTPEQRFQRMAAGAGIQISEGAADLVFVLNKLVGLNSTNLQNFPLTGRLDLERVAAMGHSAGGAYAARACQLDRRFKACVSLDGALPPAAAFPEYPDGKRFTQPALLLEVDHSGQRRGFTESQNNDYLKKKEEQLNACPIGSYDIVLKSAGLYHGSFSDIPLLLAHVGTTEPQNALYNLHSTQAFTRAFLDKYLMHAAGSLLNDASQYPGTTVMPYGHE